jgi:class 3 adenylate cyclase/DNA-binding response OmpR family regulator/tetratricopeptide (TPR) repeat protein
MFGMVAMKATILVVCSDSKVRAQIVEKLAVVKYGVNTKYNLRAPRTIGAARRLVESTEVALSVLVRAGLTEADAKVAQEIAESSNHVILFNDGRPTPLQFGCDAIIATPIGETDLVPLVAKVLERDANTTVEFGYSQMFFAFEGFSLDVAGRSLVDPAGEMVPLTRGEFELMRALLAKPGQVLSREQLLGSITDTPDEVFDRSVDVMVWRLRRKIELNPKKPHLITTVPGVGYKLSASVRLSRRPSERRPGAAAGERSSARGRRAERRHVTVLACGLTGLTSLSSRLDPEVLQGTIEGYRRICCEIVSKFGDPLTRISGDDVRFYFGYPTAREHDAESAVRAGMRIVETVAALTPASEVPLRPRAGIASGIVVVGGLDRDGSIADVVGQAPLLASQLRALAIPETVLVSSDTRNLAGGLFEYSCVGPVTIADRTEPLAWQVLRESSAESRFDALRLDQLSPMVGRKEEMALLLRRWRQSRSGIGQVVFISGEPGIGKSRLAKSLAERVELEPHQRLFYQCSPHHQNIPFYPLIAQIGRQEYTGTADSPNQRFDQIDAMLADAGIHSSDAAPLLAQLMSLPATDRYPPVGLSSVGQRRRTLAVLLELLVSKAKRKPLLVVFEDAQWADATSLEWLEQAIRQACHLPIMMIVTHRPEYQPSRALPPNASALTLGQLGPQDVRSMIRSVSRGRELESRIVDKIVEQADGIPLFVEELTRGAFESALALERSPSDLAASLAIPLTLQASLAARVDRLGAARKVAQVGAAIGREFSHGMLRRLAAIDRGALQGSLDSLEKSELVFRKGSRANATYTFAHALLQEAAYETLLKSERLTIHRQIAELMSDASTSRVATEAEVIAHHFTQAEMYEKAAEWWGKSGEQALVRSANVEAKSDFEKALGLAQRVSGQPHHRLMLRLQIGYGHALSALCGPGSPEATAVFSRTSELATALDDASERLAALRGLWEASYFRADLTAMEDLAERFATEVESAGASTEARITAERLLGMTAWFRGDYAVARIRFQKALANCQSEENAAPAGEFGRDARVLVKVYLAFILYISGATQEARTLLMEARKIAVDSKHVGTIVYMRIFECAIACVSGDPQAALLPSKEILDIVRHHGFIVANVAGLFARGWALWCSGDREIGLSHMREATELCREHGEVFMPLYVFHLSEAEALAGRPELAAALVTQQFADTERSGQRWMESELYRRNAELLLQRIPADEAAAEKSLVRAIEVARDQHAATFQLRATIGLARLYQTQGRFDAAYDLISSMRNMWEQDPELPEAREARQVYQPLRE